MDDYQKSPLWVQAFEQKDDGLDDQRKSLATAFSDFRQRVAMLVAQIHKDMPSLTVHDITHIDALWWTASEIAGPDYPINAAEAFVLGGAFLLHDSAHCIAAYPGGIDEVRALPEWEMYCELLGFESESLVKGSDQFQQVLFEVLRKLHPKQARVLARLSWKVPGHQDSIYLLPQDDLRRAYAEVIGLIAESHWHYPHQLEQLNQKRVMPPSYIHPAPWIVDVLKLALILRTADAAHIDSQRAPRFLQALVKPTGFSLTHWNFQARINKPKRDVDPVRKELCFSGSDFPVAEQDAWWLAYDTARMVDKELRAADRLLVDLHREQFAARSVANAHSSENFARNVPTDGWHPVDTSVKITNVNKMVERFGGEKLYGKHPSAALRELIQNSVDSIHACRKLGGLGEDEGEIELSIEETNQGQWLHITDTGIGMSRYVLTEVLLDFGKSLWKSGELQGEWQDLISTKFEPTGKFGIGFFSVFMLGGRVTVVTRRFETKENENAQWLLDFANGTEQRPTLRQPLSHEKLKRPGTRISVLLADGKLAQLCSSLDYRSRRKELNFSEVCARLAPTVDINVYVQMPNESRTRSVQANDWLTISNLTLLKRIAPGVYDSGSEDKHGPWTTMQEIRNKAGAVIGRAAVNSQSFAYTISGAGVHNGIFAGPIPGISGVIKVVDQEDLARSSAIPVITGEELKIWADEQAEIMKGNLEDLISVEDSCLLAMFGVDHKLLTLGYLAGAAVTYDDFEDFCKVSKVVVMHDGRIGHEDDDEVLFREFYSDFQYSDSVLEIDRATRSTWLSSIEQNGPDREKCSVFYAAMNIMQRVWGGYEVEEGAKALIGSVLGENIYRDCDIYTSI